MTELTGRVLYPNDPGWETARHGFAEWADYDANMPKAVVFCQDTRDVVNAVQWVRENSVPFRVRCGRHNYEGYSSLVKDGLIIDVSEMSQVHINADRTEAVIGAGIAMEDLLETLGDSGVTIPAATGPTVGLAGLTLGGGFGVTSRKWGLTCDNLLDVALVLADGKVVHANEEENPDLFWACRGGGGGNFGIATAFTFRLHKVNNVVVYTIGWGWDQFEALVGRWQTWAPQVDDGLSAGLALLTTGSISMYGQYTADDEELPRFSSLLQPLFEAAPPISVSIQTVPQLIGSRILLQLDPTNPMQLLEAHSDEQIFKSTSALAYAPFSPDVIAMMKQYLEQAPTLDCAPSQPSMVQLLAGGGYPSRIAPEATAVFWRQAQFVVQFDAYWTSPADGSKTIAWIEAFRQAMQPYTRGAYVNYQDDSLQDWLRLYYGDNLERLVKIKQEYDPKNFFNFPQSIPLELG